MAAVTPNINQARAMQVAVIRIEGFAKQFGEAHRNLARHAAFPFVLTPDLLYQIWANFVPEAPWTAVAHVLLSRLCRQVGYEMYEMDITDRNLLLRELKEQFGQKRFDELGEFLLDYVAQRLTEDDADTRDLAEAQEWTVLAYTKPDEAARELAQALSRRVKHKDMGEVLRFTSLIETFAEPLKEAGFEPLLIYNSGMKSFARGDFDGAIAIQIEKLAAIDEKLSNREINLDPGSYFIIYLDREARLICAKNFRNVIDEHDLAVDPETGKVILAPKKVRRTHTTVFSGRTAKELCVKIFEETQPCPVTLLNHAAYLGREFVKAELALLTDKEYIQD